MIKLIIWIVVGLLALSFFGVSLRALIDSPVMQENLSFLIGLLQDGWEAIVAWLEGVWAAIVGIF